jgi:exodeoxyribonuclease V alpha subunit
MYADTLEGEVAGFGFKSPDGGFAVARVRLADGVEVTAVGALAHLYEGQRVRAQGQWALDLRFGRQFKVETLLVEEPRTLAGLEKYLSASLDGVGPETARRIVESFGLDTLSVLDGASERLAEVPGVGVKTRERIVASWSRGAAGRELMVTLGGFGLGPAVCRRVAERFGRDALSVVQRTPYRLVEVRGIGFRTADQVARANGVGRDDPERAAAAIAFLLEQAEEEGSCFLPEGVLLARLAALDVPAPVGNATLERLAGLGRVMRHRAVLEEARPVYRVEVDRLEGRVARALVARVGAAARAGGIEVERIEAQVGLELNTDQRAAVHLALEGGLAVLTGGPGTGKTTIVKVLLAAARSRKENWVCAAPTGRAARRLTESSGQEARTLHRLLEYSMQEMRFTRDAERPLECDGVLVDEASMVDLRLMGALLEALPERARLVLVGDVDQLPSVGAGQVLRDVLQSGVLPVARLREVYRQAADSSIIRNAHRVNHAEVPISSEREEGCTRDFFVLARPEAEAARAALLAVVQERLPALGFDPKVDVQVLTPMHRGPLGTVALNEALGAALNPVGPSLPVGARTFRVGDRVLQTKNDYDLDIFNGDIGRILSVEGGAFTIDFDGRMVTLAPESAEALEHAWAISIHKSQGSEYPAVLVVLHDSHYVMLRRNLFYTAITRAKRFACVITSPRALRDAVSRSGGDERHTGLADRLRAYNAPVVARKD